MKRWCSWKWRRLAWCNGHNSACGIVALTTTIWDGEGRWESIGGTRLFYRAK